MSPQSQAAFVRIKDLTGKRFGRLTVVEAVGLQRRSVVWRCICDCGSTSDAIAAVLRLGKRTSCGCARRHTREQEVAVFWARVNKDGPIQPHRSELGACWEWTGSTGTFGYGNARLDRKPRGAHQVSWLLSGRAIPRGLCVLHHCDNPPCVNPAHLFIGTKGDNARDMAAKGRQHMQRDPSCIQGDRHWARKNPERITRGSRHGMSKLTEAAVVEIRNSYAEGALLSTLAERHGVGHTNIVHVVRGVTWRVVGGPIFPNGRPK